MEKSSKPPLRLATALLETAAGIDGNAGWPAAPSRIAALSPSRTKADSFFIPFFIRFFIPPFSLQRYYPTFACEALALGGGVRSGVELPPEFDKEFEEKRLSMFYWVDFRLTHRTVDAMAFGREYT